MLGLEHDGIHEDLRSDFCGLCLKGLGITDFASVGQSERVARHVLRLERADTNAHIRKKSA